MAHLWYLSSYGGGEGLDVRFGFGTVWLPYELSYQDPCDQASCHSSGGGRWPGGCDSPRVGLLSFVFGGFRFFLFFLAGSAILGRCAS